MTRPRVLLADDHPAVLERVASLLASTCDVIGQVRDGRALLDAEIRLHPDVLIVDISMPILNGIEAARLLKGSGAKIVFLTVHEDTDFVQAALAAGGCGYVVKSRLVTDLISAVQSALDNRRFISPSLIPKEQAPSS